MAAMETADGATTTDETNDDAPPTITSTQAVMLRPKHKGIRDPGYKDGYSGGLSAVASSTTDSVRRRMRKLIAESEHACDLVLRHADELYWRVPISTAVACSGKVADFLKDSNVRPVQVLVADSFYTPFMLDAIVDHWLFGDYEFKIAGVNNGEIMVNSRHAMKKSNDSLVPFPMTSTIDGDDGLVMSHLKIYKAALMLCDETLATSAIVKFKAALYHVKRAKILVNLVKQAFRVDFCNLDTDCIIRNLVVNHACIWDNFWTEEGCMEYLILFEEVPEFARMLKEMQHQGFGQKLIVLP